MLSLILGIVIVIFIVFLVLRVKFPSTNYSSSLLFNTHDFFTGMSWIFGIIAAGLIITICCLAPTVGTASTIGDKIAMYQEENANIEQDIDKVVKEYMNHEHDTFTNLKDESAITLVTLFPELKSDNLIKQQLEIHVTNNEKIKSLKEEKINVAKIKWLLYFGK